MEKYDRQNGKVLGKGSFGTAILVTCKQDGKKYVVKEIDVSRMPKAERESAELEAKLLMALRHPNIVSCKECFTHNGKLCIVMDYCSEGDLHVILQKRRGVPLEEDRIMDWFVQICLALKHVHDRKILHRDIKSQNVFMSAGGLLKLGDFGVSKVLNSTHHLAATAIGTPYYLSPEICKNHKYNQKSDVWSLGCILYEMTAMKHAFEAPNMRALIQKIITGRYPPPPPRYSKELRDVIDRTLTLDWKKRPSINEVLAMPALSQRIQRFLSSTLINQEFSHTIIHGRPQPGKLVVEALSSALPPPAYKAAPAAPLGANLPAPGAAQWAVPKPAAAAIAAKPPVGPAKVSPQPQRPSSSPQPALRAAPQKAAVRQSVPSSAPPIQKSKHDSPRNESPSVQQGAPVGNIRQASPVEQAGGKAAMPAHKAAEPQRLDLAAERKAKDEELRQLREAARLKLEEQHRKLLQQQAEIVSAKADDARRAAAARQNEDERRRLVAAQQAEEEHRKRAAAVAQQAEEDRRRTEAEKARKATADAAEAAKRRLEAKRAAEEAKRRAEEEAAAAKKLAEKQRREQRNVPRTAPSYPWGAPQQHVPSAPPAARCHAAKPLPQQPQQQAQAHPQQSQQQPQARLLQPPPQQPQQSPSQPLVKPAPPKPRGPHAFSHRLQPHVKCTSQHHQPQIARPERIALQIPQKLAPHPEVQGRRAPCKAPAPSNQGADARHVPREWVQGVHRDAAGSKAALPPARLPSRPTRPASAPVQSHPAARSRSQPSNVLPPPTRNSRHGRHQSDSELVAALPEYTAVHASDKNNNWAGGRQHLHCEQSSPLPDILEEPSTPPASTGRLARTTSPASCRLASSPDSAGLSNELYERASMANGSDASCSVHHRSRMAQCPQPLGDLVTQPDDAFDEDENVVEPAWVWHEHHRIGGASCLAAPVAEAATGCARASDSTTATDSAGSPQSSTFASIRDDTKPASRHPHNVQATGSNTANLASSNYILLSDDPASAAGDNRGASSSCLAGCCDQNGGQSDDELHLKLPESHLSDGCSGNNSPVQTLWAWGQHRSVTSESRTCNANAPEVDCPSLATPSCQEHANPEQKVCLWKPATLISSHDASGLGTGPWEQEQQREEARKLMEAQRSEFQQRQQEAARNRQAVEAEQRGPAPQRARKEWSPPEVPELAERDSEPLSRGRWEKPTANAGPTAEERRQAWEEMQAAARRNKQQVKAGDAVSGLAAFLGVPENEPSSSSNQASSAVHHRGGQDGASAGASNPSTSSDTSGAASKPKRRLWGQPPDVDNLDPLERRRRRLEEENKRREEELLQFQRQHWAEMREASKRNKFALLGGAKLPPLQDKALANAPMEAPSQIPQSVDDEEQGDRDSEDGATGDFAAMVKDMQEVLQGGDDAEQIDADESDTQLDAQAQDVAEEEEEETMGDQVLPGRFMLDGREVVLPVGDDASLALRVEALRIFLEQELGDQIFLQVYRRLESLSMDDDSAEVSRQLVELLGKERVPFLQLVHQLIVCEEMMHTDAAP